MLIFEVIDNNADTEYSVIALLNLVKKRYENTHSAPKINTQSFLTLAKNVGTVLDYATFAELHNKSSAIKNLVSNFNKKHITLSSDDDTVTSDTKGKQPDTEKTVSNMAKRSIDI